MSGGWVVDAVRTALALPPGDGLSADGSTLRVRCPDGVLTVTVAGVDLRCLTGEAQPAAVRAAVPAPARSPSPRPFVPPARGPAAVMASAGPVVPVEALSEPAPCVADPAPVAAPEPVSGPTGRALGPDEMGGWVPWRM